MANTSKSKKATQSTAPDNEAKVVTEDVVVKSEPKVKPKPKAEPKPNIPEDVDLNQYITVRNGFQGTLVYVSARTNEVFIWEGFGAEQEMELRELKNAKNSNKKFFINNWFMFDDDWVIDYLGVRQFYQNALGIDEFDSIFTETPENIKLIISKLSQGQKRSVIYRAARLIKDGEIDSRKVVAALEEALGVRLTDE